MPRNLLDKLRLRARSLDSVDLSNWEITNPDFASELAGDFAPPGYLRTG
jgi:hypothetical protein